MNMKKIVVAGLAALTAAVSFSALSVNANPLGQSNLDYNFEVIDGVATPAPSVALDGKVGMLLNVNAAVPNAALADGKYTFHAELLADEELENLFVQNVVLTENQEIDYFDVLEINFKDETGNAVQPEGTKLSFSTSKASAYNAVYMYESNGKFIKIGDMSEAVPTHFSRFVIAAINTKAPEISQDSEIVVDPTDSQVSTVSQPSVIQPSTDVKTGDSATTAVVFAVMAVIALGTTAVALKSKKASK